MMPLLYVETSILSYLAARRSRDIIRAARQQITRQWWQTRRASFTAVTSGIVLEEASAGDSSVARRHLDHAKGMRELEITFSGRSHGRRTTAEEGHGGCASHFDRDGSQG